ncbi:MAG TPA: RdgB/HAM1 family non-canonical purine NTP pyrophosphatase [Polyangiaceae bacterium]|nr:RdgB/HAM1 family non-canonical purine NTP pyrophosphatase [Polyangiaceae bacterium]
MSERTTLVIASSNRAKILEFRALLADLPIEVLGVSDVAHEKIAVVEDADTFEGNAVKKARSIAEVVTMLTLADDSGLEVDALGGRPGVRSARFAHDRATDAENNAALLAALTDVELEHRRARFRCVLALVDPWAVPGAEPFIASGTCEGAIAKDPRGAGGFGYDPLFVVEGEGKTMAELGNDAKNAVSHRARAVIALKPHLMRLLEHRARDAAQILAG